MAERFLLDSNIHDKLADESGARALAERLVANGVIVLLTTHIQADEIAETPDAERAAQLGDMPVESVPTLGFVFGTSRFGMARFAEAQPLEELRGGNLDHTEDALIASTARYEGATLVTEDRTLTSRARKQGIPVMNWEGLYALMRARAA